jgi:hypothetical protein
MERTLSDTERFVGLLPRVRYRLELGFAFVDDGDRLFKIQGSIFERSLGVRLNRAAHEEELRVMVGQHPSVFCLFDSHEDATRSLSGKEV